MINKLLFGLSVVALCGCTSGEEEKAKYNAQLLEEYEEFRGDEAVAHHLELIEKFKEQSTDDMSGEVFVSEFIEGKMMEFSDTSDIYLLSIDKNIGEKEWGFWHERKLKDIRRLIELPFDSIPDNLHSDGIGVSRFKTMKKEMREEIVNNAFIIILRTSVKIMPELQAGSKYTQGLYAGRILMYYSETGELFANINVMAASSTTVSASDSKREIEIENDFLKRVNSAYIKALNDHFVVKGSPPKMHSNIP